MTTGLFSPLVERALRLAARSHREHTRKGSDVPYITHPLSVALILSRAGIDDDKILAAAVLHDAVEDTDCNLEEVSRDFPAEVASYVDSLSERKRDASGHAIPWQQRKEKHLASVAAADWPIRAIALADKLHNLGTMLYDVEAGENLWERFNAPPEKIIWYHREMIKRAAGDDDQLRGLANDCRQLLGQLEESVRSGAA
jgi:(p)ppGpp synthase/HD superfamily hydrolase